MTCYLRNGTAYKPVSEAALDMHPTLPAGSFIIKQDPMTNALYFDGVDSFQEPSRLYGNINFLCGRILNTFGDRPASTGVLLTGEKGSGKTLLAKLLSLRAAQSGIPTIIINAPWKGDQFNQLIQSITQPCIILFDEFEKVYDEDDQQQVLTLLDGVFPSKKLFILTCNDKWRINQHMRNRPGRIFYMIDYKGLTVEFITEYCQENLNDKQYIETICRLATLFDQFNFDMLKALVEDMNRYNESPQEILKMLNTSPEGDTGGSYEAHLFLDGQEIEACNFNPDSLSRNPVSLAEINVSAWGPVARQFIKGATGKGAPSIPALLNSLARANDDDDDDDNEFNFTLSPTDLKHIDPATGTFTYVKGPARMTFKRKESFQRFQYGDML